MYVSTGESTCVIECQSADGALICSWRDAGAVLTTLVFDGQLNLMCYCVWYNRHEQSSTMADIRSSSNVMIYPARHTRAAKITWGSRECHIICDRTGDGPWEVFRSNHKFVAHDRALYAIPSSIAEVLELPKFQQQRCGLKVAMIGLIPDVSRHILEYMFAVVMNDRRSYCIEVMNPFFM